MRKLVCGLLLAGGAMVMSWTSNVSAQDFKLEDGFRLLFNGKNLDGWKTKTGGKSLNGETEAYNSRFTVKEGILIIDPKIKGDVIIETAKPLKGDVHIKFSFKPGKGCNNDLFLRGTKFDLIPGTVKSIKQDEWNDFEIVVAGDKVEHKCNGKTERTSKAKGDASPFGIRAEFGPLEIKNIRVKEGS